MLSNRIDRECGLRGEERGGGGGEGGGEGEGCERGR